MKEKSVLYYGISCSELVGDSDCDERRWFLGTELEGSNDQENQEYRVVRVSEERKAAVVESIRWLKGGNFIGVIDAEYLRAYLASLPETKRYNLTKSLILRHEMKDSKPDIRHTFTLKSYAFEPYQTYYKRAALQKKIEALQSEIEQLKAKSEEVTAEEKGEATEKEAPQKKPEVAILKRSAELEELKEELNGIEPPENPAVPEEALAVAKEVYRETLDGIAEGFPYYNTTWLGLAKSFNKMEICQQAAVTQKLIHGKGLRGNKRGILNLLDSETKKKIPEELLEKGYDFSISKVECSPSTGMSITITALALPDGVDFKNNFPVEKLAMSFDAPGKPEFTLQSEDPDYKSVSFHFKSEDTPPHLAKSAPGEFIASIPADYKEILKQDTTYQKKLMLIAMKSFESDYDEEKNRLIYRDTIDGKRAYYKWINIFRESPLVHKSDKSEWYGTVDDATGCGCGFERDIRWSVHKEGYLKVRRIEKSFNMETGNATITDDREEICFTESGNSAAGIVEISFDPSQVKEEKPRIDIHASRTRNSRDEGVCNDTISSLSYSW